MIEFRAREILAKQRSRLENLDSFRGLELWRDALLQRNALRRGSWGCELGSLAAELSDTDENARVALAEHFRDWERLLPMPSNACATTVNYATTSTHPRWPRR